MAKNTPKDSVYKNKEWLKKQYIEKNMSMEEIGKESNVSYITIRHWLRKYEIPIRKAGFYKGNIRNRKGKRIINNRGYALLYIPEHPRAAKTGFVYEHIIVAERMLGRPLIYKGRINPENEIVHHIDGNTINNTESNLYITFRKHHLKSHFTLMKLGYKFYNDGLVGFKEGEYYIIG